MLLLLTLTARALGAEVITGGEPVDVAVAADGRAYVIDRAEPGLWVIDLEEGAVSTRFSLAARPAAIAVDEGRGIALVVHDKDDRVSVVDRHGGDLLGTVATGREPRAVAVDAARGVAVVTNGRDDSATLIDLATLSVRATVAVGRDPVAVAVDPRRGLAVTANAKDDTLSLIDLAAARVTATVAVPDGPAAVAVDPVGGRIVVVHPRRDLLSLVDPATALVQATVPTGRRPAAVAVSPGRRLAVVANEKGDSVTLIDLDGPMVRGTLVVGRRPLAVAVAPGSGRVLTVSGKDAAVTLIDPDGAVPAIAVAGGRDPHGVAIHAGRVAVVANARDDSVSLLELPGGSTVARLPVGADPHGVAVDPWRGLALVTLGKDDAVALLDLAARQSLGSLDVGRAPRGVAIDPQAGIAVVANEKDDTLSVIDLDARVVSGTITVGDGPRGVALEPAAWRAWVTLKRDAVVQLVDLRAGVPVAEVPVGRRPAGVAVDEARRLAAVASEKDDTVVFIDIDRLAVVATVAVGRDPHGVAFDAPGGRLYVVNHGDDSIAALALDAHAVVDILRAGRHPEAIAVDGAARLAVVSNEGSDDVTLLRLPDVTPPAITVEYPPDGSWVNEPLLAVRGLIDEPAALAVNGVPVGVDAGGRFSHTLSLEEGANTIELVAVDGAGNTGRLVLGVYLDTVPPAAPPAALVTVGESVDGAATVAGAPGSVEAGARVMLTNTRTGARAGVIATADGGFAARIPALPGDIVAIEVSDAAGNTSAAREVFVPEDGVTAHTGGRVFDAATGAPLTGVKVHARGAPATARTGADGRFALPVPGRGGWTLFFNHPGYITARRDVYVRAGADATAGAVGLQPRDGKTVTISAATGGTVTDSTGNVEILFPPGALPHDLTIRASYLPGREAFPAPLPEGVVYLGGVQMGPEHVVFGQPVTVRIRNTRDLAPGTEVPFAFAAHDEADPNEGLYDPGTATVTADGRFIEFQVRHFSCAFLGPAPGAGGGAGGLGAGTDEGDETGQHQDRDAEDCVAGNSNVNLCRGRLRLIHELPPFNAFGANDAPALVYDSSTADPRPLVSAHIDMGGYFDSPAGADAVRARLTVEGGQTEMYLAPSGQTMALHFSWDGRNGRGQALPAGAYPYRLEAVNLYTRADIGGTVIGVEPFGDAVAINGRVILHDRTDSAFGAGWGLAELERIRRQSDGTLLLTRGNGGATVFHPLLGALSGQPSMATLATGMGDARSVAPAPDGGWFVSSQGGGGNVYRVAPDGTTTLHASGIPAIKGIAAAADGTLYAVSVFDSAVYRLPVGGPPRPWASLTGFLIDHLDDIAVGPDGDVYLLDGGFGSIYRISAAGDISLFYDGLAQGFGKSLITNGMSMAFDASGALYVSSNYNLPGQVRCGVSYILKFDRLGNPAYHHVGFNAPRGIAVDDDGDLLVADSRCDGDGYEIKMITQAGEELLVADGIAGDVSAFGLAYDLAWDNGRLALVRPTGDLLALTPDTTLDNRNYALFRARLGDFSEIRQDADGRLTRVQRDGAEYLFDPDGWLLERRLPQGRYWRYEYDVQGRLAARTNAAGHRWRFLYDANGLSGIVDPAGRQVFVTIDASGNLVRVEEPGDAVMRYEYDGAHRIVAKTGSRGFTTRYRYGPQGNLVEARQANGEVRRFAAGRARYAVTPAMAAASRPDAPLTLPAPDEVEDGHTDGRGHTTRLVTNRYGAGTRYTDALGNQTVVMRNDHNQVERVRYPNGAFLDHFYDPDNQLTDRIHSAGMSARYVYDERFRLIRVQSSFAPDLALVYDARDNVTQRVVGEGGDSVRHDFTYNDFGQVLTRTVDGKTTRYDYDADGRLVQVTDPLGAAARFGYDAAGNLTWLRSALGHETRYTYDAAGRLIAVVDPSGGVTRFDYQGACATCGTARHLLTAVTDALGNTMRFEYDELGRLVREIDPAGAVTAYTYDAGRNLASRTDAAGDTVFYEYDALNRLIRKRLPGDVAEYVYDVMGNLTAAADGDSRLDFGYDPAGRLTSVAPVGGSQAAVTLTRTYRQFTYDRRALHVVAGGIERFRRFTQDTLLRARRTEYGEGGASALGGHAFGYDPSGRRTRLVYPEGEALEYAYDAAGRLLGLDGKAFPGGIAYTYDALGRRTSEERLIAAAPSLSVAPDRDTLTDATLLIDGQVAGGIASVTVNGQPMTLDAAGRIQGTLALLPGPNTLDVSVTDDRGQRASRSTVVMLQDPGSGVTVADVLDISPGGDTYLLEAGGTAAVIRAGSGAVTRPAWLAGARDAAADPAGRVYTLQGAALWRHDAGGDAQVADLTGLTVDDLEVGPDGQVYLAAGAGIYRVDAGGNVSLLATVPGVFSVMLDGSGWGLVAAGVGRSGAFYRLSGDGSLEPLHFTGRFTAFAVDGAGRLCYNTFDIEAFTGFECRAPDGTLSAPGLSGDGNSRLEFDDGGVLHFTTADNVRRLEGAGETALIDAGGSVRGTLTITAERHTDSGAAAYAYDTRGQLVSVSRDSIAAEVYAYDAAGNRLGDHRATDYVYDSRNRLISGNGARYSYDAMGNRTAKADAGGTTRYTYDGEGRLVRVDLPDGAYAEYAYDPFGRRIRTRLVDAQGLETLRRYVYDGEDILLELDGSGNVISEFIHGPGIDEPLALRRNGRTYTYHADALGSIVAITDERGALVQRYEYDAYGNITFELDPDFAQPYAFTGREYDRESGLYYYRARYYDPQTGRFLTRDPLGLAAGDPNLYIYVINDPINLIDPDGEILVGAVIGGVFGGLGALATGGDILQGSIIGAATGAVGAGILKNAGMVVSVLKESILGGVENRIGQSFGTDCFNRGSFIGSIFGAGIGSIASRGGDESIPGRISSAARGGKFALTIGVFGTAIGGGL